jgi:hypothetical protein
MSLRRANISSDKYVLSERARRSVMAYESKNDGDCVFTFFTGT